MNAPLSRQSLVEQQADITQIDSRRTAFKPAFVDTLDYINRHQPDQPILCFSPRQLRRNLQRFEDGFPGEVSYAVKANSHPEVLAALATNALTVYDTASLEEMMQVSTYCPNAIFHYHNPIKSRTEIKTAYDQFNCRRFAVDCVEEIDKIADIISDTATTQLAVRFKLASSGAAAHDFSSKFGAIIDDAVTLLHHVAKLGFVPVLTFHPGSQCLSPNAWAKHIAVAADITRQAGVDLTILNVGGGFPAHYLASNGPQLEDYFTAIEQAVTKSFADLPQPALECEPGRAMVASTMSLITQVKLVKKATNEVYLNDGIYGALLETSQVASLTPAYRVLRGIETVGGPTQPATAYGPTCDPLDVLPGIFAFPAAIAEGDYVEFASLGAYGFATATNFNGYAPAKVVITEAVYNK